MVTMGAEVSDPVVELDESGVAMLRDWAGRRTRFRVTRQRDGALVLHPMTEEDADLWLSGLIAEIADNFSHRDWMIRIKADKL